ncbi:hypothetical protein O181_075440 [Austropuccinia psidii MF-1]|uniref:Endonuclease/exonuclease/phosphatase domain-containing protein n=1 Tax=Austropuccinia psidii MF-1 TaxID=1389203 RepID=A0A9Q3F6N7_9BASI|nr:hypothetical protein [Austropuccinia psidii MF-1]
MQDKDTRTSPIMVAMDANLHQKLRNPNGYNHTHPKAKELIKWCRSKGFKLTSPKRTPTYMGSNGTATTVDLTWENLPEIKLISICEVQIENHSLDNQKIINKMNVRKENIRNKE